MGRLIRPVIPDYTVNMTEEELIALFGQKVKESGAEFLELTSKEEAFEYVNKRLFTDNLSNEGIASAEGICAVAENGGVWLDTSAFGRRVDPFIAEELILVVKSGNIVENMHVLYDKIDPAAGGFGVLISGPSKTADIEQCLVYGAHGPVKHTVVIYK